MYLKHTRQQQLMALHHRKSFVSQRQRLISHVTRPSSFSGINWSHNERSIVNDSLVDYPVNVDGAHRLPHPLGYANESTRDIVRNAGDVKRWRRRAKIRKMPKMKGNKKGDEQIEHPRDATVQFEPDFTTAATKPNWFVKKMENMSDFVFEEPPGADDNLLSQVVNEAQNETGQKYEEFKNTRLKYFLTREAIEKKPKLLRREPSNLAVSVIDAAAGKKKKSKKSKKALRSPGAYSLHVQSYVDMKKFHEEQEEMLAKPILEPVEEEASPEQKHTAVAPPIAQKPAKTFFSFEKEDMERLMEKCRQDDLLNQKLLYDVRYDKNWKSRYTHIMMKEDAVKRGKIKNRAGWVIPLRRLCVKIGFDSTFFTGNKHVQLDEARAFILYQRLTAPQGPSEWLSNNESDIRNPLVDEFFEKDWDGRSVQMRMAYYKICTENDRDRVRIHGQYYNNIYLGKRMFGPGRKQIFLRTMVGGMERRFEILDNQVNHIVYTHEASDRNPDKCRNTRVKCRDSTRVVLRYPMDVKNNFIHANYVQGGSLFNKFIITQAPMDNTIGDFWRMIWQEEAPYIFMLISRKDPSRCASYWPRKKGSSVKYHGLEIINEGIENFRSPLFRVTYLRIVGPDDGKELRVEHWQGDMNNSDNVAAPLQLLRLARNCSKPTVVHCHLGISRSAALVAIEICIASMLKGPSYKHVAQKAVHLLRSQRPFSVESPMQYIYIHRVLHHFMQPLVGDLNGFHLDYKRWIDERSQRFFIDEIGQEVASYRLLSPLVDPDLIVLVRHRERPDYRREMHDIVGQLPIPMEDATAKMLEELKLSKKYPRGNRYN